MACGAIKDRPASNSRVLSRPTSNRSSATASSTVCTRAATDAQNSIQVQSTIIARVSRAFNQSQSDSPCRLIRNNIGISDSSESTITLA